MLHIKKTSEKSKPESSLEEQKNRLIEQLNKILVKLREICDRSYDDDSTEHKKEKEICGILLTDLKDFFQKPKNQHNELVIRFAERFSREFEYQQTVNWENKNAYDSIYKEIEPLINEFLDILKQIKFKPLFEVTSKMLATEQARFSEQQKLDSCNNLIEILNRIQSYAKNKKLSRPKFFISYAWPIGNEHYEEWTKDFVLNLQKHLKAAGLIVFLDQDQSGFGADMLDFMTKKIEGAEHILVICNRTMKLKFEQYRLSGVSFEYSQIIKRWKTAIEANEKGNIAIPICMTEEPFIPGLLFRAAEISVYENGYLPSLKEIIRRSYGFYSDEFEELWPENLRKENYSPVHANTSKFITQSNTNSMFWKNSATSSSGATSEKSSTSTSSSKSKVATTPDSLQQDDSSTDCVRPFKTVETGEAYQPVRLFYKILQLDRLIEILNKLLCCKKRGNVFIWDWYWQHECENLNFASLESFQHDPQIPLRVGVLVVEGDIFYINLPSFKRATLAAEFFYKTIGVKVAEVVKAKFVNRVFGYDEAVQPIFSRFFDEEESEKIEQERNEKYEQVKIRLSTATKPEEKLAVLSNYTQKEGEKPLPLVESYSFPQMSGDQEDSENQFLGFHIYLRGRELVSIRRWYGDETYTLATAAEETMDQVYSKDDYTVDDNEENVEQSALLSTESTRFRELHDRARMYLVKAEYELAGQNFEKAVTIQQNAAIYCDYGFFLLKTNSLVEAIKSFLQVIACGDDNSRVIYTSTEQILFDEHLQQAFFQTDLRITPFFISLYWLIIICDRLHDLELRQLFLTLLEDLIKRNPDSKNNYLVLSCAYREMHNNEKGDELMAYALSLDGIDENYRNYNVGTQGSFLNDLLALAQKNSTALHFRFVGYFYQATGNEEKKDEYEALAMSLENIPENYGLISASINGVTRPAGTSQTSPSVGVVTTPNNSIADDNLLQILLQKAQIKSNEHQANTIVEVIFSDIELAKKFIAELPNIGISKRQIPGYTVLFNDDNEAIHCTISLSLDEYSKIQNNSAANQDAETSLSNRQLLQRESQVEKQSLDKDDDLDDKIGESSPKFGKTS